MLQDSCASTGKTVVFRQGTLSPVPLQEIRTVNELKIFFMHKIKWTVVDIHYNESEQESADKLIPKMTKQGYVLEHRDEGSVTDYCDQYIKYFPKKDLKDSSI